MRREHGQLAAVLAVLAVALAAAMLGAGALGIGGRPLVSPAPRDVDAQTRDVAKVLKCPVCQNIAVADSPSELAQQMRDVIHKKLEAGETREQILAYFADRYGNDVLLDPSTRTSAGRVLWLGPLIIVAGGAVVVGATIRHWRQATSSRTMRGGAVPPGGHEERSLESLAEAGGLTPVERRALADRLAGRAQPASSAEPVAGPVAEPVV
jgi:cytochrome c-type biogenesis protein CcmH